MGIEDIKVLLLELKQIILDQEHKGSCRGLTGEEENDYATKFQERNSNVERTKVNDTTNKEESMKEEALALMPKFKTYIKPVSDLVKNTLDDLNKFESIPSDVWITLKADMEKLSQIFSSLFEMNNFLEISKSFNLKWDLYKKRFDSITNNLNLMSKKYLKCHNSFFSLGTTGCYRFHFKKKLTVQEAVGICKE